MIPDNLEPGARVWSSRFGHGVLKKWVDYGGEKCAGVIFDDPGDGCATEYIYIMKRKELNEVIKWS